MTIDGVNDATEETIDSLDGPSHDTIQPDDPVVIRIVDHVKESGGVITYKVQLSDSTVLDKVQHYDVPPRLVIQYWHAVQNPKRNPHSKRNRPRQQSGITLLDELAQN